MEIAMNCLVWYRNLVIFKKKQIFVEIISRIYGNKLQIYLIKMALQEKKDEFEGWLSLGMNYAGSFIL